MPSGLRNGCGAFSAADPGGHSRGSAGQPASRPPARHIPMPPFCNTPHYSSSRLRVSGSQPLSELRSLRSLRPLPSPSSSSLRSDSLSPGPSPCPCPGVDRSARGWLPETTQHMTIRSPMADPGASEFRSGGGCYSEAEGRQGHTPFRAPASSGGPGGTPHGG